MEEVEEEEASLILRRKSVDPPVTSNPQSPHIEEEPPSMVVAGVLGGLAPREEVTESESEGEAMETQSFAFDVVERRNPGSRHQSNKFVRSLRQWRNVLLK